MKFFPRRKLRKRDLQGATSLLHCAMEILWRYQRDKTYIPSLEDQKEFERFVSLLQESSGTAHYVHRCLQQRACGEAEGARRSTDPEVSDWHYPW